MTKSASWRRTSDTASLDAAVPEFLGANPRTLSVNFFVTATEDLPDVAPQLDLLFSCCTPTEATRGQNRPKPPFVLLAWGNSTSFMACVTSVTATYRMFSPEGRCIRASGTIVLEEIPTRQRRQNPTSGGTASRRTHIVGDGRQPDVDRPPGVRRSRPVAGPGRRQRDRRPAPAPHRPPPAHPPRRRPPAQRHPPPVNGGGNGNAGVNGNGGLNGNGGATGSGGAG